MIASGPTQAVSRLGKNARVRKWAPYLELSIMLSKSGFGMAFVVSVVVGLGSAALVAQEKKGDEGKKPEEKAPAIAKVGEAAPAFTLKDTEGKDVSLAGYIGKIVVLEWFNPDCPIVAAHYKAETMAKAQTGFEGKDVVWLSINSGAVGKQGAGLERNQKAKTDWKMKNAILLDESGDVGRLYVATTTPHCFVIDAKGVLAYAGGIDDGNAREFGKTNLVVQAVTELLDGKAVSVPTSKPYGCSVKYAK